MTYEQLKQTLRNAGWPDKLLSLMAAVGLAESGGNPNAINHTSREFSVGLWQINLKAHPEYNANDLRDPITNAKAALAIYKQEGINAWGAFTDGRYKKYLPSGESITPSIVSSNVQQKYVAKNPQIPKLILLVAGMVIIIAAFAQIKG